MPNIKEPLYKVLSYNMFFEEYITNNMSFIEIAQKYGYSETAVKKLNSEKYKIKKDKKLIQKHIEKTNIEKYGCINPSSAKDVQNKRKQTCLNKYGTEYSLQNTDVRNKIIETSKLKNGGKHFLQTDEFKEKSNATKIKKYGTTNTSSLSEIKEKTKITCIERYGVSAPMQSKEIQKKSKNTIFAKYGVNNVSQSNEIKEKIKGTLEQNKINGSAEEISQKLRERSFNRFNLDKNFLHVFDNSNSAREFIINNFTVPTTNKEIQNLTGLTEATIAKYIRLFNLSDIVKVPSATSSYENEIIYFLNSYNIKNIERNVRNKLDNKKEIDIYLPDLNIGIEFNGDRFHSENFLPSQNYHQNKSLVAQKNKIFIYNIYEYEWVNSDKKEKILNNLKSLLNIEIKNIYARKCKIKIIDKNEKSKFLNKYHLQGNDKSIIDLGLYFEDELLEVMTFTKPRFSNNKYNWELSRLCTKNGVRVIGGASKLFSYFKNNYMKNGESIISYNDIGKTTGKIYNLLGFTLDHISKPNYVWVKNHKDVKTRYQCQMKNEVKIMTNDNYLRIFDSGNGVWIYKKIDD